MVMENPAPPLVNRKWLLCVLASFLGFVFLASFLNQRWGPSSIFSSLRDPEASTPDNSIPTTVTQLPESDEARLQLSPKHGIEEKSLLPSPNPSNFSVDLSPQLRVDNGSSPQPSVEDRTSPLPSVEDRASPPQPSIEVSPPQPTVEDRAAPPRPSIKASPRPVEDRTSRLPSVEDRASPPQPSIEVSPPQPTVEDRAAPPQPASLSQPIEDRTAPPPSKTETSAQATAIEMVLAGSNASKVNTTFGDGVDGAAVESGKCDIFVGRWVYDSKAYPLYQARRCHFLSDQVTCRKNGRPDWAYEHWRWEARDCEIPRFNGTLLLEKLRGKRVVIVGDSLNRNQFESLACLLYTSVRPKRNYFKLRTDYKIFKSLDYDCTVEFYWSPFLVPLEGADGEPKVLKLDKLPATTKRWVGADVMVFNTGHWWTHRGHFKKWDYLEHKGKLVDNMKEYTAFSTALKTWARWVDRWVDPAKTTVFFRSISPEHKRGSNHWCYNQRSPITNETYIQWFPSSMRAVVERTIREMKTPVKYLNVTGLSEFRRDAHTSVYTTRAGLPLTLEERGQPETFADCSHWCLPGLPDTWNVLMYAYIIGSPSIVL